MEIRHAIPEDAKGIASTNAAAWREAFRGVVNDSYLDRYDGVPDARRENLRNLPPDAIQLVAVEDEEIVGWLAAQPAEEDDCDPASTFEIRACYVRPDQWRKSIGSELMNHFINSLDGERWHELILWTPKATARSHSFYESMGFRRDGKESTIDRQGPVAIVRFRLRPSHQSEHVPDADDL